MSWRRRRRHAEPAADEFLARPFVVPTDVRVGADDEHGMFLTAFTSEQALREFAPESEAPVPFNGSNVLHFLLETDCSGVVIDPGGPESFVVDRATAEAVAGPSYEALWEGSKVMLARPDEPLPASVVEALRGACARDGDVVAAYAFLAAAPGREEHPQAVLGLELSTATELSEALVAALQACIFPPEEAAVGLGGWSNMDIRVLDDDLLESVRDEVGIPVYRRADN
jgi:hypothetical protein